MPSLSDNPLQLVREMVLDTTTFIRLTINARIDGTIMPWRRVIIRPVLIKNKPHLQFSYFDASQDTTKNYRGVEATAKLDELLCLPFKSMQVQSTSDDVSLTVGSGGQISVQHSQPVTTVQNLAHDASKTLPLPADQPDAYLQAVGIMDSQGKIRPGMHDKFSQINQFLKLLDHTGELEPLELGIAQAPLNILDCGCGSSYLTFAVYHYLNHICKIPTNLMGIDVNAGLIEKSIRESSELHYDGLCFRQAAIVDYQPDPLPDIVIALHACDTATDDAIAQGIRAGSRLILCAPCCHHDLNQQLEAVAPFRPVMRHGILKQRMADILTDAFRALILRIMGYKTDVIEFVSSDHTNRNLMIRAVRRSLPDTAEFVQEYNALKQFWSVTPYLEKLLINLDYWQPNSFEAVGSDHDGRL